MTELLWALAGLAVGATLAGLATALWAGARARSVREELAAVRARQESAEQANEELRRREAALGQEIEAHQRAAFEASQRATALAEQQKALEARLEERSRTLQEAEQRLLDAFSSVSAQALGASTQQFLALAQQTFQTLLKEAKGDQEKGRMAIDALVRPIHEALQQQQRAIAELEQRRQGAYQGLEALVRGMTEGQQRLQQETGRLVAALRRPEQRGRWGELQLRNAVELAGMSAHCDFVEQVHMADDEGGRLRPDMVVNLPGGGRIVVDAKVALDAYLDALQPDADRDSCLRRHAAQVQSHVAALSRKSYWKQFERTPSVVVMFMPLESALGAALEVAPDLHARAMEQNVLIATPTLLVALLRAVAYGWRQEDVAANAQAIAKAGRELHERLAKFLEHLEKVGEGLERSTKAYNNAIRSLESRVLPSARKFRELNATASAELELPETVQSEPRAIAAPERAQEQDRRCVIEKSSE